LISDAIVLVLILPLLLLTLRRLSRIDNAANGENLIARIVLDDEGESVVGFHLIALTVLVLLVVLVIVLVLLLLILLLALLLLSLHLFLNASLVAGVGRADALCAHLDRSLVNQFVQMGLFALLLLQLLLDAGDAGEVGRVAVESVLNALLL